MLFRKFFTLSVLFISGTSTAYADFHRFAISELFSNADGTIQYIEMIETRGANDQQFLNTSPDIAQLSSTDGLTTNSMFFPNDLPSAQTANKFFLIATAGFAGLTGAVTPDYIMSDSFLFIDGGTVVFADQFDPVSTVNHGALPIDGILSLNVDFNTGAISTGINSPTNFAGAVGSIDASVVPVPPALWLFGSGLIGMVAIARRRKTL